MDSKAAIRSEESKMNEQIFSLYKLTKEDRLLIDGD